MARSSAMSNAWRPAGKRVFAIDIEVCYVEQRRGRRAVDNHALCVISTVREAPGAPSAPSFTGSVSAPCAGAPKISRRGAALSLQPPVNSGNRAGGRPRGQRLVKTLSGCPLRVVIESPDMLHVGRVPWGTSYVSDHHRAVLDAAQRPRLVDGLEVLAEAFASAAHELHAEILMGYADRLGWAAALRRLGSLADALALAPRWRHAVGRACGREYWRRGWRRPWRFRWWNQRRCQQVSSSLPNEHKLPAQAGGFRGGGLAVLLGHRSVCCSSRHAGER